MDFGVYVHVPFCTRRCGYCDFATWDDRPHLIGGYVEALCAELDRARRDGITPATSVFFGGGTPSLLSAAHMARLLRSIERVPDAEVTVEANPDGVDEALLHGYGQAGVNRVSFGVQSMSRRVLERLDRTHDPESVGRAVEAARAAGLARVGIDLIYGTPGEDEASWLRTLGVVGDLDLGHVSAYALSVEPGTPLARRVAAGELPPTDPDIQAALYEVAEAVLSGRGLEWYEISNWARPGEECRHNQHYWTRGDYLGVGAAAHSHRGGRRWWNVRTPERYVEQVAAGRSAEAGAELLDATRVAEEAFALALRTRAGALVAPPALGEACRLAEAGLLGLAGDRAVLSLAGRLLAGDLTARLLLAGAAGPERPESERGPALTPGADGPGHGASGASGGGAGTRYD